MVYCGIVFEPGASGLPYYCTPPVCDPAVIGALAVWWQHKKPTSGLAMMYLWQDRRKSYATRVDILPGVLLRSQGRRSYEDFRVLKQKTKTKNKIRSGVRGPSYYCAPLVCVPAVIRVLAGWHPNQKLKGECSSSYGCVFQKGRKCFVLFFFCFFYMRVRMPSSSRSIAGVPSGRALPGFPITAHHLCAFFSDVIVRVNQWCRGVP